MTRKEVRMRRGIMEQLPLDLRQREEWLEEEILVETPLWYNIPKIIYHSQHRDSTFATK